jgi:hypothetical protein
VAAVERPDPNAVAPDLRQQPRSRRGIAGAGLVAGLLCNFWVLESLLAGRTDPAGAWISDLAARSEVHGWRFELLEVASGAAVVTFALLLLRDQGGRAAALRRGFLALAAAGVLTVIGGAAPLECAEGLEAACSLDYDPFDLIHAGANLLEIAATTLAFGLVAVGLRELAPRGKLARVTLAIGGAWLALTLLSGLSYLGVDVDSVKGLCQRGGQVLFGTWLALLGAWASGQGRRAGTQ